VARSNALHLDGEYLLKAEIGQIEAIETVGVGEADLLVAEFSASSARRERVFLEKRLAAPKQDLDQASKEFSQLADVTGNRS
jgi:hypothetical protein